MIGEQSRGYLLEVTLSKIRFLMSQKSSSIQLIAMSATLPNLREIALWLDAFLFVTQYRPVEIKEYIKIGNEIKSCHSDESRTVKSLISGDKLGIFPLI